ncbi:MAG: replication-associated recombination protein A [Armatimonadota bacterium]|nr:replication-associated recombination protein A [Armatimonadota bacterium]
MDLFAAESPSVPPRPPLAERMRPQSLEEFVGQEHLVGKGRFLSAVLESEQPPSLIFWGPPGSGKTTLAHLIAKATKCRFVFFSAVLSGVKEVRELVAEARNRRAYGERTILFVDEIHRFNRGQQDAFLPHVEDGTIILMGATTENPSFEVNAPLLSRCKVLTLRPLRVEQVVTVLRRAVGDRERGLGDLHVVCDDELLAEIAEWAEGDARRALNLLEQAVALRSAENGQRVLTAAEVREAAQHRVLLFDKSREEHYNVISAFIKSLRGSDPDAAVYWLARLLEAGEDPLFVARRMVIFASEDVGNADPQGLVVAVAALQAFHAVGMPEGWIPLSHAATYLATAPKSNASYLAYRRAAAEIEDTGTLPVPLHLRNAPTKLMKAEGYAEGYRYPHDFPGHVVRQQYLPERLADRRYYDPSEEGYEREIRRRLEAWRKEFSSE